MAKTLKRKKKGKGRGNRPKAEMNKQQAVCYELFLRHTAIGQISKLTGVSPTTLEKWIKGHDWDIKRMEADEKLRQEIEGKAIKSNLADASYLADQANKLMKAGMDEYDGKHTGMFGAEVSNLNTAQKIELGLKVDKHRLLITGDPTEIHEHKVTGLDMLKAERDLEKEKKSKYEKVPTR